MVYVYPEKDLRTYPSTIRSTEEWNETYKIWTTMERSTHHVKDPFGLAPTGHKTKKPYMLT